MDGWDFKSGVPSEQGGRWVRFPCTSAISSLSTFLTQPFLPFPFLPSLQGDILDYRTQRPLRSGAETTGHKQGKDCMSCALGELNKLDRQSVEFSKRKRVGLLIQ